MFLSVPKKASADDHDSRRNSCLFSWTVAVAQNWTKPPLLETKGFFLGAIHKKWNDGPLQKEELVEKHVFAKKYVLGVKCRILSGISIWGGILYGHAGLPLRINLLIIELRIIHPRSTPRKTNMTMENQPIEGVSKRLSHTCLHLMRGTFTYQTKSRDSFISFLP